MTSKAPEPEPTSDYGREMAWETAAQHRLSSQVVVLGLFVLLGLGLLFSPIIYWVTRDIGKERRFDRQVWIDAERDGENIRGWMVDDLFRTHDFHGMTRNEVEAVLGPPEDYTVRNEGFIYMFGPDRAGFGIDSEWLFFEVDTSGRVTKYGVTGD